MTGAAAPEIPGSSVFRITASSGGVMESLHISRVHASTASRRSSGIPDYLARPVRHAENDRPARAVSHARQLVGEVGAFRIRHPVAGQEHPLEFDERIFAKPYSPEQVFGMRHVEVSPLGIMRRYRVLNASCPPSITRHISSRTASSCSPPRRLTIVRPVAKIERNDEFGVSMHHDVGVVGDDYHLALAFLFFEPID